MTHVVTEACIRCKYTDCVDVSSAPVMPLAVPWRGASRASARSRS